jgi:hypothetical protein
MINYVYYPKLVKNSGSCNVIVLGSNFVIFWHILTGQINKKIEEAEKIV